MRTNIVIDDDLIEKAREVTGLPTMRAIVHEALRSLVESRSRESLLDLKGKIRFAPDYDYKAMRSGDEG